MTDSPVTRAKVLFAIGSLESGGSETQLTELLLRIHEYGVDATLVLMESPADRRRLDRLKSAGIQIFIIDGLSGRRLRDPLRLARGYANVIRAARPDVIYAWLEETAMFLVPLGRLRDIPVVVARRNISGSTHEHRPHVAVAMRQAEAAATLVTGNSEAVLASAAARGVRTDRLRLVPNGHPALAPLPQPEREPVAFGYLARFRPEKGHMRFIEAIARLPRDRPWRVRFGGDGVLEAAVRAKALELRIADRLEFLGDVHDVRGFWRESHIAVLLSDHEGSPNALIEAAFAGRPIVATRVGGSAELVTPEMGLLVPPDDIDEASSALAVLLRDPELRARMGAAAHEIVARRHCMDASVQGHAAVLFEALGHRLTNLPNAAGIASIYRIVSRTTSALAGAVQGLAHASQLE